jgi:hypothetical protein
MNGGIYSYSNFGTALVPNINKTLIQMSTAANTLAKLLAWSVSFNGIAAANTPVHVWIAEQTTAGTGTVRTKVPLKLGTTEPGQVVTVRTAYTAEPGYIAGTQKVYDEYFVYPSGGLLSVQFMPEEQIEIGATSFLGLMVNAPQAVNAAFKFVWAQNFNPGE